MQKLGGGSVRILQLLLANSFWQFISSTLAIPPLRDRSSSIWSLDKAGAIVFSRKAIAFESLTCISVIAFIASVHRLSFNPDMVDNKRMNLDSNLERIRRPFQIFKMCDHSSSLKGIPRSLRHSISTPVRVPWCSCSKIPWWSCGCGRFCYRVL